MTPTDLGPDTGSITQPITVEVTGEEQLDKVQEKAAEGAKIDVTTVDKNSDTTFANIKGTANSTHP